MRQRGFGLIVYLIAGAAILGMLSLIAYRIHDAGYQQAKAECERAAAAQREKEQKQANTAATKLEKDNAKAKIVYRTITKTVDKIVERPVYRNVCLDADGLHSVNAALAGALTPAAEPDKPLPKPDASGGRDGGGGAEKAD